MRISQGAALIVALAIAGCAHGTAVPPSGEGDSIDVSPGRNPEPVRAALREAVKGIGAFAVRPDAQLPADSDARTRIHFVLAASGKVRVAVGKFDDTDPQLSSDSLVLDPKMALIYVVKRVELPAAPADVEVSYEFKTPDWFAQQKVAHQRMLSALEEACATLSLPASEHMAHNQVLAKWAQLPLTPENAFKRQVGTIFAGIQHVSPPDDARDAVDGLCDLTGRTDFASICPALASTAAQIPDCTKHHTLELHWHPH